MAAPVCRVGLGAVWRRAVLFALLLASFVGHASARIRAAIVLELGQSVPGLYGDVMDTFLRRLPVYTEMVVVHRRPQVGAEQIQAYAEKHPERHWTFVTLPTEEVANTEHYR